MSRTLLSCGIKTKELCVKASDNNQKMAKGIAESLSTIGECCVDMQVDIKLFPIETTIRLLSDFYGEVFLFLSDVMEWMTKKSYKRMLKSFNDDLVLDFEDGLERIKQKAARIRHRAEQISRAESRSISNRVESLEKKMSEDMRLGATGLARQQAEMRYVQEKLQLQEARIETYRAECRDYQQRLGRSLKLLLEENLRNHREQSFLSGTSKGLMGNEHRKVAIGPRGDSPRIIDLVDFANVHCQCSHEVLRRCRASFRLSRRLLLS